MNITGYTVIGMAMLAMFATLSMAGGAVVSPPTNITNSTNVLNTTILNRTVLNTTAISNVTNVTGTTTPLNVTNVTVAAPVCNIANTTMYLANSSTVSCGAHYKIQLVGLSQPNSKGVSSAVFDAYWNNQYFKTITIAPHRRGFIWGHGSPVKITVTSVAAGLYSNQKFAQVSIYKR